MWLASHTEADGILKSRKDVCEKAMRYLFGDNGWSILYISQFNWVHGYLIWLIFASCLRTITLNVTFLCT